MKKYPYHFVLHNKEQGLIGIIEYNGNNVEFSDLVNEVLCNHFDLKDDLVGFNEILTNKLEVEFEIELHTLIDNDSQIFYLEKTALYNNKTKPISNNVTKILIEIEGGTITAIQSNMNNVQIGILDRDYEYPVINKLEPDSIVNNIHELYSDETEVVGDLKEIGF